MKIRKFNENSERRYLGTPPYICPVCGEEKEVRRNIDESYLRENAEKYIIIDYNCDMCNFKWYSEYMYSSDYEADGGSEIVDNEVVPIDLYSPEKIESKKYNI